MTWVIYFLWSCVDGQVTNFRGLSQSSHFPMSVFWASDISHVILVSGLQLLCPQFPGFTGGSSKYNWPRYQNLSFFFKYHNIWSINSLCAIVYRSNYQNIKSLTQSIEFYMYVGIKRKSQYAAKCHWLSNIFWKRAGPKFTIRHAIQQFQTYTYT